MAEGLVPNHEQEVEAQTSRVQRYKVAPVQSVHSRPPTRDLSKSISSTDHEWPGKHKRKKQSTRSASNETTIGSAKRVPTRTDYKQVKRKILLVGKAGSGKSSFGSFLLSADESYEQEREFFTSSCGLAYCTSRTEWKKCSIDNIQLYIIDTPGLGYVQNIHQDDEAMFEFGRALSFAHSLSERESEDGVDAILLCVQADQRFSLEVNLILSFLEHLGEDVMRYLIPVFTMIDRLEGVPTEKQRSAIKKFTKEPKCSAGFKHLMLCVKDDFVVVNSKDTSPRYRQRKVSELMTLIGTISRKNSGKKYTNNLARQLFQIANDEKETRETLIQKGKEMQSALLQLRVRVLDECTHTCTHTTRKYIIAETPLESINKDYKRLM